MKKIAICEDSEIDRRILVETLKEYFREIDEKLSIAEYSSGEELLADIEEDSIVDAEDGSFW